MTESSVRYPRKGFVVFVDLDAFTCGKIIIYFIAEIRKIFIQNR